MFIDPLLLTTERQSRNRSRRKSRSRLQTTLKKHQSALSEQSGTFWAFQNFLAEVRILSESADETYSRWHDSSSSFIIIAAWVMEKVRGHHTVAAACTGTHSEQI